MKRNIERKARGCEDDDSLVESSFFLFFKKEFVEEG